MDIKINNKKKNKAQFELLVAVLFIIICIIFVFYLRKLNPNKTENNQVDNIPGLNIDMNKTIENPTTEDLQELINNIQNTNPF